MCIGMERIWLKPKGFLLYWILCSILLMVFSIFFFLLPSSYGDNFFSDVWFMSTWDSQDHNSADVYTVRYTLLCRNISDICSKLRFRDFIDSYRQYVYVILAGYAIQEIDTLLWNDWQYSLLSTLRYVDVYDDGGSTRGQAWWYDLSLFTDLISNEVEFFEVMVHEIGHIIDLGILQGSLREKDSLFTEFGTIVFAVDDPSLVYYKLSWTSEKTRISGSVGQDFCSGYGMTNPFEDFAECLNLYLNHHALFLYRSSYSTVLAAKYDFMYELFGGQYLFANESDIDFISDKPSFWRPWDTTRMYY